MLLLTVTLAGMLLPGASAAALPSRSMCRLITKNDLLSYFQDGDLIVGGIVQVNVVIQASYPFFRSPYEFTYCDTSWFQYIRHLLAFVFAIEEINKNPNILPNLTLGFQIFDSCSMASMAVESVLRILSGKEQPVFNYMCYNQSKVVAIIGHPISTSSQAIAGLNAIYKYPQISYGAVDQDLSNKVLFPYFYRTVPNGRAQYAAIIQLLLHFGWTWVGIIASDEGSNQRDSEELKQLMRSGGICVEYLATLMSNRLSSYEQAVSTIRNSTSSVVILYSSNIFFLPILYLKKTALPHNKIWILTVDMSIFTVEQTEWFFLNGSLMISVHKGEIPGLKDFLQRANPSIYLNNVFLQSLWLSAFKCLPADLRDIPPTTRCKVKETLKTVDTSLYDVNNFRVTYSVYSAVYAVAHALNDMLGMGDLAEASGLQKDIQPWKLHKYVRKVHFNTTAGEEVFFDENGDAPPHFDILGIFVAPNKSIYKTQVGQFISSLTGGPQLYINESSILWGPYHSQTPRSVCTESCSPGYRKAIQSAEKPACCYDCILCPEGAVSNKTDMENCITCAEDQWSNERRDACTPRSIEFLSYDDQIGATLAASGIFFSVLTFAVLWVFLNHRDTPIVKANNRDLTYILLLSLIGSFLCSLLFIGPPLKVTCLVRQASIGIIFAVAVSSILAKTIIVVIAFNATKPGRGLKQWLTAKLYISLVLLCTLGEVLICTVWLILAPPFSDIDTRTETGKMILLCNEGSITAFFSVVGYNGLLALLSFMVAYLARKLPDRFNEAQHISFSMLVFCCVWVSFIPAYLSTKGRYMVILEIVAILASSAGLLGCIFVPKCYIILLRPEQNSKQQLMNIEIKGKK